MAKINRIYIIAVMAILMSLLDVLPVMAGDRAGGRSMESKIIRVIPHDTRAFTQGLLFHGGYLYESTGKYGHSSLRQVDPATGKFLKITMLSPQYFGEGLELNQGKFFMLTWKAGKCLVFGKDFKLKDTISYTGEGWGLCKNSTCFAMSNGTNVIQLRSLDNFKKISTIDVRYRGYPVPDLNELEFVGDKIWANIWMRDKVAVIDPGTGQVVDFYDFSFLRKKVGPKSDVLNGLAYDPKRKELYVTGKYWDKMFILTPDGG